MFVSDILKIKGVDVVAVNPDETVLGVLRLFRNRKIGFAVIGDPSGELLGTVSERDICQAISRNGEKVVSMAVLAVMTQKIERCKIDDPLPKVMALMTAHRTRHLLVIEDGKLQGVVSIGDVVKNRLDEVLRGEELMLDYIAGTSYSYLP